MTANFYVIINHFSRILSVTFPAVKYQVYGLIRANFEAVITSLVFELHCG